MARNLARPAVTVARRAGGRLGCVVGVRGINDRVVLTFDDGPEPGGTEGVLTALSNAGARATFFVLLTRTRRFGALLDEVVAAGHEIALHGIDHRSLTTFPPADVRAKCVAGRAELEDRVQRPVHWLRPPYGRQTYTTGRAIRASGLVPVLFGPSTGDTIDLPAEARVQRAAGAKAGAILLAHDGYAGPLDNVDDGAAPILDRGALITELLTVYAARGLRGCALGDVLSPGGAGNAQAGRAVRELRYRR